MPTTFFSDFALIGKDLELKERIYFQVTDEGLIKNITNQPVNDSNLIEFKDALVVPGFINAHTHIGDSFAKDQGIDLSLPEVVEPPNGLKHRLLKEADKETIIEGMKNSFKEMLSSGTTTFTDFREGGPEGILILKEALKGSKIRAFILGRAAADFKAPHEILKMAHGIGLSSTNVYEDNELEMLAIFCIEGQKVRSVHVSETKEERKIAFEKFNMSDIERAIIKLQADLLVHAIHADDKDIHMISEKNIPVVICPRANGYFGIGFPPISKFLEKKLTLCLGTDNVMANSPDLFREMEFLHKFIRGTNGINVITSKDILKMVTINPAQALRLDHLTGSLEEGKYADFFVLDLKSPNLIPFKNIHDNIVLRAKSENVISTYVKGKLAYDRC
ncbi:MAG: amidohydrolase family protein [Candidatus Helarchaeota archaeon]